MNAENAKNIVERFLGSAFGSLEALLGTEYTFDVPPPEEPDADRLDAWCGDYPVWMHTGIAGGGSAALLWRMEDATALVASVGGEDPGTKTTLDASDQGMLQELTDAILGGGAAGLSELLGEEVMLEGAGSSTGKDRAALSELLGTSVTAAETAFSSGGVDGKIVLIYSQTLEDRISLQSDEAESVISDEEMGDILSGFTPDDEPDHAAGAVGPTGAVPENLSVVMDIELLATARLGMIEVPIADVLNYGPGSIIEMGHAVDEPIELLVNGKLIARGDVVVVDEKFGLRITEIVSPQERIESLR